MADLELHDEFDLFQNRPARLSVVSTFNETIRGTYVSPRYPGSSHFNIPPSPVLFTSSKILLKIVFRVMKKESSGESKINSGGDSKDKVAIVNNFLHSAFSNVALTVNGVTVQNPTTGKI